MTNNLSNIEVVYLAEGRIEAQSVKLLLESFGLTAYINQESAGIAYGLTVGPLGVVEVLVPQDQVSDARKIIQDMENGKLEVDDNSAEEDNPTDE